jgi:hypothetical protein
MTQYLSAVGHLSIILVLMLISVLSFCTFCVHDKTSVVLSFLNHSNKLKKKKSSISWILLLFVFVGFQASEFHIISTIIV